jgi:tetratricopeptide (TPR) repeat protein
VTYSLAGQFEQAERAYRTSLAVKVRQHDLTGEADSLHQLGGLYHSWGRSEESVKFYRHAADIYVRLRDESREGRVRNNLGRTLLSLQRYDEARRELTRAVECGRPYGHSAELWKTWDALSQLEQAAGSGDDAAGARARAAESYISYRRDGGQSTSAGAQLCATVAQAITGGHVSEMKQSLSQLSGAGVGASAAALISHLQSVLDGARDPTLANDPNLSYDDAVELLLLLEAIA